MSVLQQSYLKILPLLLVLQYQSHVISVFLVRNNHFSHTTQLLIILSGFPTQEVHPITTEGISTAGFSGYTLICNTSKESDLPSTSTLVVQWLDQRGNLINAAGVNFTVSGSGPTTDTVLTSRLTFNHLYTSQAGVYTCRTLLTIPGTVSNHTELTSITVYVKCQLSPS